MELSVILPSHSEAKNLKEILPNIHSVLEQMNIDYEILVIDTMLPIDDTKIICEKKGVICIPRENGNLYGDAIRTGFKYSKGKFVVTMDADGSHNPSDIMLFYTKIKNNCDLIIGSRYIEGGKTHNGFILKAMSWVLNLSYSIVFRLRVKDVSNSYRMYKGDQIRGLRLECNNFDIVEEILIKLSLSKDQYKILEVPVNFAKREEGKSKRNLWIFVFSYIQTMIRLYIIKRNINLGDNK